MEKVKQERRIELCFEEHVTLIYTLDGWQSTKRTAIGRKVEENASDFIILSFTVDEACNFMLITCIIILFPWK